MSKEKSIFEPEEGFASGTPSRSPFAIDDTPSNPFAGGGDNKSPFASEGKAEAATPPAEPQKAPVRDPFAGAENKSPFSYDTPASGAGGSSFDSPAAAKEVANAFGGPEASGFGEPAAAKTELPPSKSTPPPLEPAVGVKEVKPEPTTPVSVSTPSTPKDRGYAMESGTIRQLELRAIFGVDRELSESEIMDRSRALPGIRHLARVSADDVAAVETAKRVLGGLGFGDGQVKLQCGGAPVEFMREGQVVLAIQTDGGFAPGVRETLMIVSRELARI